MNVQLWEVAMVSGSSKAIQRLILAVALLTTAGQPVAAQEKISFTDSWSWAGYTAYFLLAEKRGYFAQEGLQVSLNRGYGSGKVPADLAAGTFQIGSGDINPMIVFNAQNPTRRVVAIALVDDTSPLVAVVRADGPIRTPKDFEGRTLSAPDLDAGRQFFPVFAEANGFDANKVKWLSVQGALRETLMVRGQADGVTGFINSAVVPFYKLGLPQSSLRVFLYQDYGVNLYGRVIMTSQEFAEKNPKAVKGFLRAVFRAKQDMLKDPEAGLAALKEKEPLSDIDMERQQWELQRELIVTDNTKKNGLSSIDWGRLDKAIRLVERTMSLPGQQNGKDVYTDAHLPPREELQIK